MFKRRVEASVTVEAAFVVPIVLFVIVALIYLTFYLHDRVRLEEVVESALRQGNLLVVQRSLLDGKSVDYSKCNELGNWGYWKISYGTEELQIKEYLEGELEQGFFFLSKESVSCEVNGFLIEVKVKMRGKISLNPIQNFWKSEPEVTLKRSIPIHNPEEVLRIYEGLQIIVESTESAEFIKNYMEKFKNFKEKGAY